MMDPENTSEALTAEDRKLLKKLRGKPKPKKVLGKWSDLPPAIEECPEDALDNGDQAKVGQIYYSHTNKSHMVIFDKNVAIPWHEETEEDENFDDSQERARTVHGIEVWSVNQPLPIKNIPSPEVDIRYQLSKDSKAPTTEQRERHDQEINAWKRKSSIEQTDTSIQSLPILPNGKYWSERWLPKIKDENGKWRPALANECAIWYSLPEDKRRIDYLEGVIPDE